jgi:tRNA(Arg) A34 adenosine deaminase TadA
MNDYATVLEERNSLAILGLLAHAFLTWDPPVPAGLDQFGKNDFTHYHGLNIQAMIIDNTDGEVLALTKNGIHDSESPLIHAEQNALKEAILRIKAKRERKPGTTVENWYRKELFYQAGANPEDFISKGATLITTLEPCPFCASAICVSRVKRTSYLFADSKFGGGWQMIQNKFYPSYQLQCDEMNVQGSTPLSAEVLKLFSDVRNDIDALRQQKIQDTWFLDKVHKKLEGFLALLTTIKTTQLLGNDSQVINGKTLDNLKRLLKIPEL